MATPVLPNPQNFLAVALAVNRSRDGPALVFHYPPHLPVTASPSDPLAVPTHLDILLERIFKPEAVTSNPDSQPDPSYFRAANPDHHVFTKDGTQVAPWDYLAGFPVKDLVNLLTPARAYHKKLFEVSLDPLHFISCPIHVPEDGVWKKKKQPKSADNKSQKKSDSIASSRDLDPFRRLASDRLANLTPTSPSSPSTPRKQEPRRRSEEISAAAADEKRSSMTMFNLVLIINPKKDEARELVNVLHINILKKLNKALKYAQQHSDFVWKESKRIIAMKEHALEDQSRMSDVWKEILGTSSLATSLQTLYEAISQNKIATLQLDAVNEPFTASVQIPVPFFVDDIIPETDENRRGLWLTTANTFISEESLDNPVFLDRNFALLLLDNEKKIINELQADSDQTTPAMVEFVRHAKPTVSFHQVGQTNLLNINQVRRFAQHFMYWRRAMAVPPLHARDIYIVSPNSDPSRLPRATQEWARIFPLAPPLPDFLMELSRGPRPYRVLCPSKHHPDRPRYFMMLAWLLRNGWVTQLCTFAYVVVWPEILYEVDYQIKDDEIRAAKEELAAKEKALKSRRSRSNASGSNSNSNSNSNGTPHPSSSSPAHPTDKTPSPQPDSLPASDPSQNAQTLGEQIAERARLDRIATKAQLDHAARTIAHARRPPPIPTAHPSTNTAPHLAGIAPYIIHDAKRATGRDSMYLAAIGRRLASKQKGAEGQALAEAWQRFWVYFDGRTALERVALHEDLKRKEVWALLSSMSEHLLMVRHW